VLFPYPLCLSHKCAESIGCLSEVTYDELVAALEASPLASIMADESNDRSTAKNLIIYSTYLDATTFEPTTEFMSELLNLAADVSTLFQQETFSFVGVASDSTRSSAPSSSTT
jgi:hypothetical protein